MRALLLRAQRPTALSSLAAMLNPERTALAVNDAPSANADYLHAHALLRRTRRGVPRGYLQMICARVIAGMVRDRASAADALGAKPLPAKPSGAPPPSPGAAPTPRVMPKGDVSVVLAYPPPMAPTARRVVRLLCGEKRAKRARPLPSPLAGTATELRVVTRYYSSTLSVLAIPDTAEAHEHVRKHASKSGALVLLFDSSDHPPSGASFSSLTERWASFFDRGDPPEILLALGVGRPPLEEEDETTLFWCARRPVSVGRPVGRCTMRVPRPRYIGCTRAAGASTAA